MSEPGSHVCVMVSPEAGRGRGGTAGADVVARLRAGGHRITVVDRPDATSAVETAKGHLNSIDTSGDGPVDALVVVGGDGSVHVALNALLGGSGGDGRATVPFGIVPCGTGNDFARTLGIPAEVPAAVAAIDTALRSGTTWRIDAIHIARDVTADAGPDAMGDSAGSGDAVRDGERWAAGVLSAGFDAVVSERANAMTWVQGSARYALAVARELPPYRARRYVLDLDGETWEVDALLVGVANAGAYGGGMRIAPSADIADGVLDVVVVRPLSKLRFVGLFPKVYKGTHVDLPYVEVRRAKRVRVSIVDDRAPLVAYADGERLGPLPLTCEVHPAAVPLLAVPPEPPAGIAGP